MMCSYCEKDPVKGKLNAKRYLVTRRWRDLESLRYTMLERVMGTDEGLGPGIVHVSA